MDTEIPEIVGYIGEVRYGSDAGQLACGEWIIHIQPDGEFKAVRVDFKVITMPASVLWF